MVGAFKCLTLLVRKKEFHKNRETTHTVFRHLFPELTELSAEDKTWERNEDEAKDKDRQRDQASQK